MDKIRYIEPAFKPLDVGDISCKKTYSLYRLDYISPRIDVLTFENKTHGGGTGMFESQAGGGQFSS